MPTIRCVRGQFRLSRSATLLELPKGNSRSPQSTETSAEQARISVVTRQTDRERLADLKDEVRRSRPSPPAKPPRPTRRVIAEVRPATLVTGLLKVLAVILLPFIVSVRSAVFLYLHGWWPSAAIAGGALLALAIVAVYATALARRFTGRARLATVTKWVAAPLVSAWIIYGLLNLASANAKSPAVRESYRSVHPVLRMALATVILADEQLVVTDMIRTPSDYTKMGLPVNDRTMHYRQPDGWVHAVDLRTNGQGMIRSRLVQLYFWSMGFSTLRHVGTADHLHVQLPMPRS